MYTLFRLKLKLFFILLSACPIVHAESIPPLLLKPSGLTLRLVSKSQNPDLDTGIKTILVGQADSGIEIQWFSQKLIKVGDNPWPEYKIKMEKGKLMATHGLDAHFLFHPHLWIEGDFILEKAGLLWAPAEIFDAPDPKKSFLLEPGLLYAEAGRTQGSPLQEKISSFQNLAQPILNGTWAGDASLDAQEVKKLKNFLENLSLVSVLDTKGDFSVVINGKKEKIPVIILGNNYFSYTVLKNKTNPLILNLSFNPSSVPKFFQPYFLFFQKYLEYQITQIQII